MKELVLDPNYVETEVDVPELAVDFDNTAYIEGETDEKVYNRIKKQVKELDKK